MVVVVVVEVVVVVVYSPWWWRSHPSNLNRRTPPLAILILIPSNPFHNISPCSAATVAILIPSNSFSFHNISTHAPCCYCCSLSRRSRINKRHHIMAGRCLCKDFEAGIKIVNENRRRGGAFNWLRVPIALCLIYQGAGF